MLGPGLVRCSNPPTVIATETKPGDDGLHGSVSLCESCKKELLRRFDAGYATFNEVLR